MKMKTSLYMFDLSEYPQDMKTYLRNNGFHFNKKACKEAIKGLRHKNQTSGKVESLSDTKDKEEIESLLTKHGITLDNDCLYDSVWVYNMLVSDFWKSGIDDEAHLAKAVKDVIDDPDQPEGFLFNRWVEDRLFAGIPIEWSDLI